MLGLEAGGKKAGVKSGGVGVKKRGVKMRTPNRSPPSLQLLKTNANLISM